MNKRVERTIYKIYSQVFNKLYTQKRLTNLTKGSRVDIITAAQLLESSDSYEKFATKFAKELAKQGLARSRGIWQKYYKAARKLGYISLSMSYKDYELKCFSEAVKHNFKMIKSIPSKTLTILEHKYTSTLIEEIAKGNINRGSFERMLFKHGNKNAKLIARTETAKLQTAIAETRSTSLGSVAYIWLSSNDRRTRPSHKAMNGVVVFWRPEDEKPRLDNMSGNAGEYPNCRCSPQPIVDTDDLKQSWYNVYDYHQHKVVRMSKADLISAIKNGSLD